MIREREGMRRRNDYSLLGLNLPRQQPKGRNRVDQPFKESANDGENRVQLWIFIRGCLTADEPDISTFQRRRDCKKLKLATKSTAKVGVYDVNPQRSRDDYYYE